MTIPGESMSVCRYPGIYPAKEEVEQGNAIQPGHPSVGAEAAHDVINGVGSYQYVAVRTDQPHSGVKVCIGQFRKLFGEAHRLPGQILKKALGVSLAEASDLPTAKRALAVINNPSGLVIPLILVGHKLGPNRIPAVFDPLADFEIYMVHQPRSRYVKIVSHDCRSERGGTRRRWPFP